MKYSKSTCSKKAETDFTHHRLLTSFFVFGLVLGMGAMTFNLKKAFADGNSYELSFQANGTHTMAEDGGHLKVDGEYVDLKNATLTTETIGTASCTDNTHCKITVSNGPSGVLNYNSGNKFTIYVGGQRHDMSAQFSANTSFVVDDYSNNDEGVNFTGSVWFFWNCGGSFCKYKMTELLPATEDLDHNLVYMTNYFKASDVKDGSKTPDIATLNQLAASDTVNAYDWVWEQKGDEAVAENFASWDEYKTYRDVVTHPSDDPEEQYAALQAYAIDPTGASSGKSIISTNGNRAFRATIYDESAYYGISNASSINNLTYYPSFWDQAFFNPAYDISGTTLENPAIITTYLLEPSVTIRNDEVSAPIKSIEIADGTPASAVEIRKEDTIYNIFFKSNFYDHVIFKVTNMNGGVYYVMIARITVDAGKGVIFAEDPEIQTLERDVACGLYVPKTDSNEYDIYANYTLKDGSTVSVQLEKMNININGGKNLNYRAYKLKAADAGKVSLNPAAANAATKVQFLVVKANSTETRFMGALAGSGKGTGYILNQGNAVFDTRLGK